MIDPVLLCDKHLLGEHGEIHKFKHTFEKGYSFAGRVTDVIQIEPRKMKARHDELAAEMTGRGMNHRSPYEQPCLDHYDDALLDVEVDVEYNMDDLSKRCAECAARMEVVKIGRRGGRL